MCFVSILNEREVEIEVIGAVPMFLFLLCIAPAKKESKKKPKESKATEEAAPAARGGGGGGGNKDSLSVDESNAMRAKLGMWVVHAGIMCNSYMEFRSKKNCDRLQRCGARLV